MEEKKNILTYAGLRKLEDELHDLKVNRRKEVAGKIKEAREQGDLSENAEYDAAKDEQRDIEARIEEIEKILKNAEVVVEDEVDSDKINIGCKVSVYDMEYEEEMEFSIVGSTEANSLQGKISNESPVGRALIGAKVGDIVSVESPAGTDGVQGADHSEKRVNFCTGRRPRQRIREIQTETEKKDGRAEEAADTGTGSEPPSEGAPGEARGASGGGKGSLSDHQIPGNASQPGDKR